jgi:arylsulfatase A-like enzyme
MHEQVNFKARKQNVIWIFGDQHRAQALGCNGDPNVSTPNIDNLSLTGVNFTAAVAGSPLCCPYRGSLLTSRYPHKCVPGHQRQMPPDMPTIAAPFNDAGYHTAYFGKWHLDGFQEGRERAVHHIVPPERRGGFQNWIGYENNNSQYDTWVHGGEGEEAFHYRLPGYETDALTDLLIDYIEQAGAKVKRGADQPFFAALSVQPPHDPYIASEDFMKHRNPASLQLRPNVPNIPQLEGRARRDLSGYYGMIENLDWNLGRIRQALSDAGLDLNTHLMFFSDHGDMHGSHGQFRKLTPHEESIRVPFIIGGEQLYGRAVGRYPIPINHVDIAPTTLGLCGIDKPIWMEGTDYSHIRLNGSPQPDIPDSAYLQSVIPTGHHESVDRPWRGIVTRDGWKYVCFEGVPWMMFNLHDDPYEQVNMAYNSKYADIRKKLNDRLARWIMDTEDQFTLPSY